MWFERTWFRWFTHKATERLIRLAKSIDRIDHGPESLVDESLIGDAEHSLVVGLVWERVVSSQGMQQHGEGKVDV